MLNILSLGAGVQSSTVLLMSCRGVLPKLDCAIFADTGWEPKAVYEWLNVLDGEASKAGIPIHRVSAGNIREDALRSRIKKEEYDKIENGRWVSMPFYVSGPRAYKTGEYEPFLNEDGVEIERFVQTGTKIVDGATMGQIKRQCTKEYKISPIEKKVRELWGDEKRTVGCVSQWMGISGDEMRRCRTSRNYWIMFYYPLIFAFDRPWHRLDCANWLKQQGFPDVPRSACLGCPYHSDEEWRQIKSRPEEWADVVAFDSDIRKGVSTVAESFLHRSCQPLDMVDLSTPEERGQQNWLSECEGMCGV